MHEHDEHFGCGGDGGCDRRAFLAGTGVALGGAALAALGAPTDKPAPPPEATKQGASVRAAFLYPPSTTFANDPDGWWSWPGNHYDAEGRQRQYTAALRQVEKQLGMRIDVEDRSIANAEQAQRLAQQIQTNPPDGLLVVMFYNRSLAEAELLLKAAADKQVPVVFYIDLGVKHGQVGHYRRPGVYFIQSLDNLDAIAYGLRMIHAKKRLAQSVLLSINEAKESSETVEPFLGTRVRVIPFARYAEEFQRAVVDAQARQWIAAYAAGATEIRGVTPEALESATRAHLALKKLLADEKADGLTMNCLRRGMLKPCMSFATLNSELVPAACENDLPAAYTQLLGQLLTGRPGFQHNPCYDTERNHYYGSHCTCPTRLHGPDRPAPPICFAASRTPTKAVARSRSSGRKATR